MKARPSTSLVAALLAVPLAASPQALPEPRTEQVAVPGAAAPLSHVVQLPAGYEPAQRRPLLLLLPDGAGDLAAAQAAVRDIGAETARGGFVVVSPAMAGRESELGVLCAQLRQSFRIEQGGMHLGGGGAGAKSALRLALAHSHQFQTISVWGEVREEDTAPLRRLRHRRVQVLDSPDAATLRAHFAALHAARAETGVAADVAFTLDDFHDAAAKGDEAIYFAIFPDDAVFLGTDATERWTGAQFKAFAMPYFERGPAWIYVPLRRWVTVSADGAFAWFDEVLDNEGYGECRGSGVLERRAERWVVRQYNLTVPVPNDLLRGVAERIRAFAEGRAPATTTIVVVRHAEKAAEGDDPGLTEVGRARAEALAKTLRALPVRAVFTTPFARTVATVAPLCRDKKLVPVQLPAAEQKGLVARVMKECLGQTVLVCGHSNTVPAILKAFGVREPPAIADDEFDSLFVVTVGPDGAQCLALRYGGS
jgi:phosphohistidine phosphatase SixA